MSSDPAELPDPWVLRQRELVGDRLRSLRLRGNLTQEALAKRIGIDSKTISRAENARTAIDIDEVALLAKGLGVPASWLFTDDRPHGGGGGAGSGAGDGEPLATAP